VEVLGQLHGQTAALRLPITVIDIGSGGFSIETPVPFPDRTPHDFRFTTADGEQVELEVNEIAARRRGEIRVGTRVRNDPNGETVRANFSNRQADSVHRN